MASVTAVILAGGLSRRMGGNAKGMYALGGFPLLEHVAARLALQVGEMALNAREAEPWQGWGWPLFLDRRAGSQGPLAGVEAALSGSVTPWVLTAPCDTPFLPLDLVQRLQEVAGEDGLPVVVARGGRLHATLTLWPRGILPQVTAALDHGERRLAGWLAGQGYKRLEYDGGEWDPFFNVNTPEALAEAEGLWQKGYSGVSR